MAADVFGFIIKALAVGAIIAVTIDAAFRGTAMVVRTYFEAKTKFIEVVSKDDGKEDKGNTSRLSFSKGSSRVIPN